MLIELDVTNASINVGVPCLINDKIFRAIATTFKATKWQISLRQESEIGIAISAFLVSSPELARGKLMKN